MGNASQDQPTVTVAFKTKGIKQVKKEVVELKNVMSGFVNTVGATTPAFKKQAQGMLTSANAGTRLGAKIRLATHGMRGFRMEMLGVMFFGMALQRFFGGLLKPALTIAGVFELMSNVLGILFLPIALVLLDILLPISDYLMSMSESAKLLLGAIVLAAAGLGLFLFFVGMMSLGIGSIIQVFGPFLKFIYYTAKGMMFMANIGIGTLLLAFGILLVIIIGFAIAWKDNLGQIKQWTNILFHGLKAIFAGIVDVFMGIKDILVGLFTGDTEKFKAGFKKIVEGIKSIFFGLIEFIAGLAVTIGISLVTVIMNFVKVLVTLLGEGFGALWEGLLQPALDFGKDLVMKIIEGVKSLGSRLMDIIRSFIPDEILDLFGAIGGALFGAGAYGAAAVPSVVNNFAPVIEVPKQQIEIIFPPNQNPGAAYETIVRNQGVE